VVADQRMPKKELLSHQLNYQTKNPSMKNTFGLNPLNLYNEVSSLLSIKR